MWVDSIGQGECGAQVSLELRDLLDQRKQKRIHCFLVRLALLRQLVLLQRENKKQHQKTQLWSQTESPSGVLHKRSVDWN